MTNPPTKAILCIVRALTGLLCIALFAGCGSSPSMVAGWSERVSPDLVEESRLRERLRRTGEDASGYAKLASLRLAAKDPSGAQDDALKGLSLSRKHIGCLLFLARAQRDLGRLSDSSQSYASLVGVLPSALGTIRAEWEGILHSLARQAVERQNAPQLERVLKVLGSEAFESSNLVRLNLMDYAESLVGIHLRNKDLAQAQATLERARGAGGTRDRLLFLQAQIKAASGAFEASKKLFKRWVATTPSSKRWARVARYFRSLFRLTEARWAYEEGTGRFPESGALWRGFGHILVLSRQPTKSQAAWERAARLVGKGSDLTPQAVLLEGAKSLRQAGYREQALVLYRHARRHAPRDSQSVDSYGEYLLQLGMARELIVLAEDYVSVLIAAYKAGDDTLNLFNAVTGVLKLVESSGRLQVAVKLLERVNRAQNSDIDGCLRLATLRDLQSHPEARDSMMATCHKLAQTKPSAQLLVAEAWFRFGVQERALLVVDGILSLDPHHVAAVLLKARIIENEHNPSAAAALLTGFIEGHDTSPDLAIQVAEVHREAGRYKTAQAILATALGKTGSQDSRRLHRALAFLYLEPKFFSENKAIVHLRSWLPFEPSVDEIPTLRLVRKKLAPTQKALRLRRLVLERLSSLPTGETQDLFRLGELQLESKDFEAARRSFHEVLQKGPFEVASVELIARRFLEHGEKEHAYTFLDMLHPSQIESAKLLVSYGRMLEARRVQEKARACHEEFLKRARMSGNRETQLAEFATYMVASGNHELAVEAFQLMLEQPTGAKEALAGLGKAYFSLGRRVEARNAFEKYLGKQSVTSLPASLGELSDFYAERGATKEAARFLEEKLGLERSRWQAPSYGKLCALYREHGDIEGIRRVTKTFMNRGFNLGRGAEVAARELGKSGLYRDALDLLEAVLKKANRRMRNYRVLLRSLIHYAGLLDEPERMLTYARRYAGSRGKQKIAWTEAAEFLADQHRYELAISLLSEAIQTWPNDPLMQVARGQYLLVLGRADAAEREFTGALAKATALAPVMKEIRRVLGVMTHPQLLAKMEKLARAFQPGRVDGYLTIGAVLLATGDLKGAKRSFARYLEKNPRGHLKVARAYGKDHAEEALRHYQNADMKVTPVALKALSEVGSLLSLSGDVERMKIYVRRFLMQARKPQMGFEVMSRVWLELGRPGEAIRWLKRALQHAPTAQLYRRLATLYFGNGERGKALDAFIDHVAALGLSPSGRRRSFRNRQSYVNSVQAVTAFYLERSAHADVAEFLERLEAKDGSSSLLASSVVEVLLHQGRTKEALAYVERKDHIFGNMPSRYVERPVRLLGAAGFYSEALTLMRRTHSYYARGVLGRLKLRYLVRLGRTQELEIAVGGKWAENGPDERLKTILLLFAEKEYSLTRRLLLKYLATGSMHRRAEVVFALGRTEELLALPRTTPAMFGGVKDTRSSFGLAAYQALLHQQARRPALALKAAQKALRYKPANSEMLLVALQSALLAGDQEASRAWVRDRVKFELTRAERVTSRLKVLRILRAMYAPHLESYALELILERTSFQPKIAHRYVRSLLRIGEVEKAKSIAEELILRSGDILGTLTALIESYLHTRQIQHVSYLVVKHAEVAPNRVSERLLVRFRMALLWHDEEAAFDLGERLATESPDAATHRLQAAHYNERYRGPVELTNRLLKPSTPSRLASEQSLRLRARAGWRSGDLKAALASLNVWLKRYGPQSVAGVSTLTDLLRESVWAGDRQGIKVLVSFLEFQTPNDLSFVVSLITGFIHDAPPEAAIHDDAECLTYVASLITRAETRGLDDPLLVSSRAYLAEAQDDLEGAERIQRRLRDREGDSPTSLNNLAYLYARSGKHLEKGLALVRQSARQTLRIQPSYSDTEGWILHRMGRSSEGLALVKEALHLSDWSSVSFGNSELLYHYGELLLRSGKADEAQRAYRECARYAHESRYARFCLEKIKRGASHTP
jgi:tetratricopeptide (TPR) repeat protein